MYNAVGEWRVWAEGHWKHTILSSKLVLRESLFQNSISLNIFICIFEHKFDKTIRI